MNILYIVKSTINKFVNENNISSSNPSEYVGSHSAPDKDDNDPMHNVINMFPDMYTDKAYKYYGGYGLDDVSVINQIKSVYNKPNKPVVIYRAVPYLNKDVDKEIKTLNDILKYHNKFGFFPMKNQLVRDLEEKIWNEKSLSYDEMQNEVYNQISHMIDDLIQKKQKSIKINNGDWVTTSRLYAKHHGESNLNNNYKIVTKTVKASQLYTDGNSIFEWGYNV